MIFTVSIKRNADFSRVYKKGRYFTGKYLILYVLKGEPNVSASDAKQSGESRYNALGVTASKKVGKSVRRNRLKRLVKENYRLMEERVRAGFFIIFVIRAQDGRLSDFYDIRREMASLLNRAGVLSGNFSEK